MNCNDDFFKGLEKPKTLQIFGENFGVFKSNLWPKPLFPITTFVFKRANPSLFFFIFVFSKFQFKDKYIRNVLLQMLGFKPQIYGVGSDRSANCATTTALIKSNLAVLPGQA